jgi:hypothetical protein
MSSKAVHRVDRPVRRNANVCPQSGNSARKPVGPPGGSRLEPVAAHARLDDGRRARPPPTETRHEPDPHRRRPGHRNRGTRGACSPGTRCTRPPPLRPRGARRLRDRLGPGPPSPGAAGRPPARRQPGARRVGSGAGGLRSAHPAAHAAGPQVAAAAAERLDARQGLRRQRRHPGLPQADRRTQLPHHRPGADARHRHGQRRLGGPGEQQRRLRGGQPGGEEHARQPGEVGPRLARGPPLRAPDRSRSPGPHQWSERRPDRRTVGPAGGADELLHAAAPRRGRRPAPAGDAAGAPARAQPGAGAADDRHAALHAAGPAGAGGPGGRPLPRRPAAGGAGPDEAAAGAAHRRRPLPGPGRGAAGSASHPAARPAMARNGRAWRVAA